MIKNSYLCFVIRTCCKMVRKGLELNGIEGCEIPHHLTITFLKNINSSQLS